MCGVKRIKLKIGEGFFSRIFGFLGVIVYYHGDSMIKCHVIASESILLLVYI